MRGGGWALCLVLVSLAARAQLARVDPPELSAGIAGRVCQDVDGDGQCAPDEPGLAGIRLVLSTGREVRTDAHGRYHFIPVDARGPDGTGGLHLRPGRQRLRVDARTLPPSSTSTPEGATVEVPWAGVVLQDFAVRTLAGTAAPPLVLAYDSERPPSAVGVPGGVEFVLAGHTSRGDEVEVEGVPAEVDARGDWRARVRLVPGANELALSALGADHSLRLLRQRIDVVARQGGLLIAPREPTPRGTLRLPGTRAAPPSSGATSLTAEFPPGTRVRSARGEVTVGAEGSAQVPLTLEPGDNTVELTVQPPGEPARSVRFRLQTSAQTFAVGLLDVEATFSSLNNLRLRGRGTAHVETHLGPLSLVGELDLRDTDVDSLRGRPALDWLRPRLPRQDEVPDPDLVVPEWADTSVSLTPNATESRLRLELSHERWGRVGVGTYRATQEEGEVGRYHRPLFGPYAELAADLGRVRAGVKAFAGALADPLQSLSALPAYEELRATGGSLYYLGSTPVAEGSEALRVEVRDGITGLPLAERHLVRGRDYQIDYSAGRVLLAHPLSFVTGEALLRTGPLTSLPEPVLCAEYAVLRLGSPADTVGGEAWAEWKQGRVSVSAVREPREGSGSPYQLLSAHARTTLGGYTLLAEVARSRGTAVQPDSFGVSDDGGLSFLRPEVEAATGGDALGLRLRGPGLFGEGSVEAAFRRRTAGFSDGTHSDSMEFRQLSLRVVQPLGPWRLTLMGDDRLSADPRVPFALVPLSARTLGAGLGYEQKRWGVGVEVRDSDLDATLVPGEGSPREGGRTSVGVEGHWAVNDWLTLSLSHRQALALRGEGPGRVDDTFSAAGVDVKVDQAVVGVRGGWGPALGPLAWVHSSYQRGQDVYYGSYSVDVDGPDFGASRAVSGASTQVADGTSVFVEDVASHDAQAVRLARAVGFEQTVFGSLHLGARYERGLRGVLDDVPGSLRRDVASVSGQLLLERFQGQAHVELRMDQGTPERGAAEPVARQQVVALLSTEATLRDDLSLSGRLNYGRTGQTQTESGGLEARLLEGYAALAWRPGRLLLVARYGLIRELLPGERSIFGERAQQIFSLLPALRLGDRFALAAGLHASRSNQGALAIWVFTGSLRPSVRVVGGLEVALEGVHRSVAPTQQEALSSLRGEVAYRVNERMRVAAGYTLLGFIGTGLPEDTQNGPDRFYVRAELAY